MKGWNGSKWINLGGTTTGNLVDLANGQIYSAIGFVGHLPLCNQWPTSQ